MQLPKLQLDPVEVGDLGKLKISKRPGAAQYDRVLTEPVAIQVGETVELVALPADEGYVELLAAARTLKYNVDARTSGLMTASRTFGHSPRIAIRRDFCTVASSAREHPKQTRVLYKWAQTASARLREFLPDKHAEQVGFIEQVSEEWRIPNSVFTSGICNRDSAIGFHHDGGNFKGAWSAMYAFQRDMDGGLLVLPELRTAFAFEKPTLIMFDGARLLHGVTRLRPKGKCAYRYSIVYYALQQLTKCGTPAEELERIKRVKTEREHRRLNPEEQLEYIKKHGGHT